MYIPTEQDIQKHIEQVKAKKLKVVERLAQKDGLIVSKPAHPNDTALFMRQG